MSRCSSAKVFGGSGMPSGVSTIARRSAPPFAGAGPRRVGLKSRMPSRARVAFIRLTTRVRSPTRHSRSRYAAVAPFPTQPPQEPPLQQFGVEPVGIRPAMFPRYGDTRGIDHVRLYPTRLEPARGAAALNGHRPASAASSSSIVWPRVSMPMKRKPTTASRYQAAK